MLGQWSIGWLVCRQRVLKVLSSLGGSRPAEVLWRHCCQPNMGGQQWRHLPPGPNLKPSTLEHARFAIISASDTNSGDCRFPENEIFLAAWLASARLAIRRLRLKASLRSRGHGSELSSARLRVVRLASTRLTTPRLASPRHATHETLNLEEHGKAPSLVIP